MVAKISIGSSLYGALCYNGEKVNKENGRILGSNKIIIPVDGRADIGQMAENFRLFMPKMGKTKKPVLHISLNPHPDDRLSDQDFEILAREYLEKLGFGEQPYVIYKHMDIDRHHIHIVTVNVNEEGKRLNQDFLYRRSKKITTELEEKYNLHKAQREKISPDTPITKIDPNGDFSCQREQNGACSNYAERSRERREAHIKRQVANTVKMVGMRYKFQSMGEYNAILGLYNVRCDTADGRVNGREYHGLVYFATDDNGNTIATPLKASRLGKFASRTAIDGRFERAKEKIDVAPTKRKVAEVLNQSDSKDDFVAKLKERNIDVVFRYTDEGRIYGVTFVDHDTMTALNGSRLGKEFSANALYARFSQQPQPTEQAPIIPVAPAPEDAQQSQSTSSAGTAPTPTQSQSVHSDSGDYDFTLPGLDLFQPGQSFNPDEEEFRRRMQRKKKRGHRPKF
ncbi:MULTISPECIES: relaxase/mobilization nuclease domain-containing protein [Muribaculaceae]|uniref:relaxase/mobilization nuclease domain-containing protein n=1 Tax=Muribaculaceae TaxID=2005473 RepID=UPI002666CF71|nr:MULTISPECIES: relaxase/mobilization nuclease domain-containing protein [Muribaculaceae]